MSGTLRGMMAFNEWNKYDWLYELYLCYKGVGYLNITSPETGDFEIYTVDWCDDGYGNIVRDI